MPGPDGREEIRWPRFRPTCLDFWTRESGGKAVKKQAERWKKEWASFSTWMTGLAAEVRHLAVFETPHFGEKSAPQIAERARGHSTSN